MRTIQKVSPVDLDGVQVWAPNSWNPSQICADLLELPAQLVPDLPLGFTLTLEIDGAPARVQLSTELHLDAGDSLAEVIMFDREELRALIVATQADRMWRKDLLGVCFDKWRKPDHRLTLEAALAGANPDRAEASGSFARVLARLGATVVSIELADDVAPPLERNGRNGRLSRAA